jgi:nucleotide-binding universal stress UspA family protein
VAEFRTILVPHDFSPDANAALEAALDLARRLGAEVHLVHSYQQPIDVLSPYGVAIPAGVIPEIRDAALARLRAIAERHAGSGVALHVRVVEGTPSLAITDAAEQLRADLIVMGTRGLTGLRHLLLGSVAERTVRTARCPVLTVKAPEEKA